MKIFLFVAIPVFLIITATYMLVQHLNTQQMQKGALQITSKPVSKVYLDGKYIGRTPISKTEPADMLQAGNYNIKLEPLDTRYSPYQEKISIATGIMTVVDRTFRTDSLSEGYVISLSPLNDKNVTELEVVAIPVGSSVALDSEPIGKTPLLHKNPTESDHIINVSKNGYNEKSIRIRTPKGFKLTVIAYLSIGEDGQAPDEESATPAPQTPAPSPTPASSILILDTPTGFLRVRQSPDINSAQITTVTPDSTYPLLNEQTGWYQIKLDDDQSGWVSSEYSRKQ